MKYEGLGAVYLALAHANSVAGDKHDGVVRGPEFALFVRRELLAQCRLRGSKNIRRCKRILNIHRTWSDGVRATQFRALIRAEKRSAW